MGKGRGSNKNMPKITIITANMGGFESQKVFSGQTEEVDHHNFTDENLPPRYLSMTPRMQARIPKIFGWQMAPDYDIYIWVDSSLSLLNEDSVKWFLKQLGDADMAFFKHPDRSTIQEEHDFIKHKLEFGGPYLKKRYTNELLAEQLAEIKADKDYVDDLLIASSAFVYRNNSKVQEMMKEWWYHTSRYHSVDQLGLPYALKKSGCKFNIIEDNYLKTPYLTYTRKR